MKILILDLETTVERIEGRIDNSPKNPRNKCVGAYWGWLGFETVDEVKKAIFYHNDYDGCDPTTELENDLADADMMICHNAKFDAEWLLEMGFTLPPLIFDTMIVEYLLAKGQRRSLSLKESAIRRKVTSLKKSDLIDDMFKGGMDFSEIPLETVNEYAEADVKACGELYIAQLDILEREHNQSLKKVIPFMNEMLLFLCEIEMNGVKVDLEALEEVEREFLAEKEVIEKRLNEIVEEVMGDTPINLNSGADMTKVVYSREVISREAHRQTFNIGTNEAGKSLRPPFMNATQFVEAVRATTRIVHKTQAVKCSDCNGVGSIQKFKVKNITKLGKKYRVQGDPYKNRTKCKTCSGVGAIYVSTGVAGGLRMSPSTPYDASINGFKTDKETIKQLVVQAERKKNEVAVEFLSKISRLNALSTYLDSFVAGIQRGTRASGFLHANFNQCIASTGRLSSGGGMSINLQNQPKRGFPVRKCFISRFENGIWIESDYSGLEFRTCVELSRDAQGLSDILEGKDIHAQSAGIILKKPASEVTKEERQSQGKPNTFLPLFGGTGYGSPPHVKEYFSRFYDIYEGIHAWHKLLMSGTLKNGTVETPSGRQYYWPNVERTKNGRVTSATQILNYPVQGFSADLVQLACIRTFKLFKQANLRSKLTLTVHDSICVDTHPDEVDQVNSILTEAMTGVGEEAEKRFGYKTIVPFDIEISGGANWLDQVEYA